MRGRNRFFLLVTILAVACLAASAISLWVLYDTAIEAERMRLMETAQSQARLIEAVARFDQKYSTDYPHGSFAATLSQIRDAHGNYTGLGETGEFTLARKDGDKIVFLMSHRHADLENPQPVDFNSNLAEPMRLALSGKSGTIIGLDYRGQTVLAAYEPVQELSLGIVAKLDLAEIRAPFIKAAFFVLGLVILFVLLGVTLSYLVTAPVVRILEEQNKQLSQANRDLAEENKQRHQAEESLQEIKTRLTRAQRIARMGDFTWEVETGEVTWSEALYDLLGYDPSETIDYAKVNKDIHHPEDLESVTRWLQACVNSGEKELIPNEYRLVRKNGETIYVRTQGIVTRDEGQSPKIYAIVQDITEQKNADLELQNTNILLDATGKMARVGGWEVNAETKEVSWTNETYRIHEVSSDYQPTFEEAVGFFHPDDRHRLVNAIDLALEEGILYDMEIRFITARGNHLWTRTKCQPHVKDGRVTKLVGTFQDITDRRQAEEELAQIFSMSLDMICIADIKTASFRKVNPAFTEILGYSEGELLKKSFMEFIHPDDIEATRTVIEQQLKAGRKVVNFENRYRCKNGNYRWLSWVSHPDQERGKTYAIARDITEKKQAEEELRISEQRFRTIVENANDAIFIHDFKGNILDINENACQMLGYTRDELVGSKLEKIDSPENTRNVAARMNSLMRDHKIVFEGEHVRKDGSHVPVEISAKLVSGENDGVVQGFVRDISERKQAEENILKSESRLNSLVNNLFDALIVTDTEGKIVFANPSACGLFGRKCDLLVGADFGFTTVLNESFEIGLNTPEGIRHAEARAAMTDWGGESAYLISLRDITDRKRAEEEKAALENQLHQSQRLESIGQLAGGIAHDFNNMLSVILGYGDDLLDDLHPNDPMRESVREIVAAGKRSAALTRQLLAFSRRQTLQPEVLDLNVLIRNLEKMLRRLIGENIELTEQLAEDLDRVEVDPGQIEQVIMNLAVNARDAMPHGGKLTIQTQNVTLDEQYADTHIGVSQGEYVMLSIYDTGSGMDEETRSKVFEPFFTTKERGKGTGLGLSTVYGIIKQSGGYIWVYSETDQGTCFKIYLPRTIDSQLKEKVLKKEEAIEGNGELILVVEDEPSLRKLTERFLDSLNYQVLTAANGGEAILLIEEKKLIPDLVLTDVVMPGMSGKVLIDRLKKDLPEIKVLYMSGYTNDAIAHHGILETDTAFIQKPFNKNDLGKLLREVLDEG